MKTIEKYHHNSNYYGTGFIDKIQEEKIDELIEQVNHLTKVLSSLSNESIKKKSVKEYSKIKICAGCGSFAHGNPGHDIT